MELVEGIDRSVYSEVMNPQSVGDGRSNLAVYGKMITFGESYDLAGQEINDGQKFFVYDVVGGADSGWPGGDEIGSWLGSVAKIKKDDGTIEELYVNVAIDNGSGDYVPAGIVEEYIPKWGAAIDGTGDGEPFIGAILILRQPQSGTVSTFVYSGNGTIQVNQTLGTTGATEKEKKEILFEKRTEFKTEKVDFCVNMEGYGKESGNKRRNIRIIEGARNTSGVELIDLDGDNNECK